MTRVSIAMPRLHAVLPLLLLAACNGRESPAESDGMSGGSSGAEDSTTGTTDETVTTATTDSGASTSGDAEGSSGAADSSSTDGGCVPPLDATIELGEIEVVEASPFVGGIRALEIAPSGEPLIAYLHDIDDLWVGERADGQWSIQSVHAPSYTRIDDAAASFGPDGVPIVKAARFSDGNGSWYTGSPSKGVWTFEYELSRSDSNFTMVDLARGDDGVLHTLYARSMSPSSALEVWVEPDSSSRAVPLDAELSISNLVLDDAGIPHLAYQLPGDGVFHTTLSDGAWVDAQIDTLPLNIGVVGLNLSRTPDDRMVASFVRSSNGELVIATQIDGSWDLEVAHQEDGLGFSTLRIDETGARHLWYARGDTSVAYARHDGVQWQAHELGEHPDQVPWYLSVSADGSSAHLAWGEWTGLPREGRILYRRIAITPTCE